MAVAGALPLRISPHWGHRRNPHWCFPQCLLFLHTDGAGISHTVLAHVLFCSSAVPAFLAGSFHPISPSTFFRRGFAIIYKLTCPVFWHFQCSLPKRKAKYIFSGFTGNRKLEINDAGLLARYSWFFRRQGTHSLTLVVFGAEKVLVAWNHLLLLMFLELLEGQTANSRACQGEAGCPAYPVFPSHHPSSYHVSE